MTLALLSINKKLYHCMRPTPYRDTIPLLQVARTVAYTSRTSATLRGPTGWTSAPGSGTRRPWRTFGATTEMLPEISQQRGGVWVRTSLD